MSQKGFSSPVSRQGLLCRDRVLRPSARPDLGVRARQNFLALCRDRDLRLVTGFPGILGYLGRDRGFLYRDKDFWPCVAT